MAAACGVLFALVLCLHNVRKSKDGGISESKDVASTFAVNIDRGMLLYICAQYFHFIILLIFVICGSDFFPHIRIVIVLVAGDNREI
jgi:hypothetical protein